MEINSPSADEQPLKPGEAAARLGVSYKTLKRLAERGTLRATVLPSGHHRYARADVDRLAQGTAS